MTAGALALQRTGRRPWRSGARLRPLARPPELPEPGLAQLPQRYRIAAEGGLEVLRCPEAPTLRVRAARGLSFTAQEARNAASGSIFLDGVAACAPFADLERQVYNLDHHEGCVRAFTLSCCEQALVLLRKGLDLRRREWTLYLNDADLDGVLAVWLLLNHLRLDEAGGIARARVLPLLRLEGAIDAHGLEFADLCGFPPDLQQHARAQMDQLRAEEVALRAAGEWGSVELLPYLARQLRVLDAIAYSPSQLRDVGAIEELARSEIGQGKIAVVCRSELGIYAVEHQLRRFHGARLGVIALQQGARQVTLRQLDFALPATLEKVYTQLNWVDPAAGGHRSRNRWGGSDEIGGSPRATGTRLDARQIAEVCRIAYRIPGRASRIARSAGACALALALAVAAGRAPELLALAAPGLPAALGFPLALFALAALAFALSARRAPHFHGMRLPCASRALALAPLGVALGALGGCWLPASPAGPAAAGVAQSLALVLCCELIFRGWLRSALVSCLPHAPASRAWSVPLCVGATFAAATLALQRGIGLDTAAPGLAELAPMLAAPALSLPASSLALTALLAFGFGALLDLLRDRCESLAVPLAVHAAAALLIPLAL